MGSRDMLSEHDSTIACPAASTLGTLDVLPLKSEDSALASSWLAGSLCTQWGLKTLLLLHHGLQAPCVPSGV